LLELLDDLALGGEATLVFLGEERLVFDAHHEDAAAAADQIAVIAKRLLDFGRQTGGPRKVVSNAAVIDSNAHQRSPAH
jgi:hypothetical protein